jgi:RNA polymerase sigma-70 factor (ECF subfamily)
MADESHDADAEIVRSVLSGDRDCFGQLVGRYLPMVHALVRANLGTMGDVDDIAQDAFLSAFNSLDKLRDPEKFAGWLATITRHECVRHAKERQRDQRNASAWSDALPVAYADDPAKRELHVMLEQAVRDLDVHHREILLLYYFSKKDLDEIESVLGISRENAKKRLQRARAALESHITTQVDELLDAYKPRKEHAARVIGAIAIAQPAWHIASEAAATASALATWGAWIMNAKTLAALGTAAVLAGLGVVAYSYGWSERARESSAQRDAGSIVQQAVPQAEKPSAPVASGSSEPSQTATASEPELETAAAAPEPERNRTAKSKRTGMVGGNPQRTGYYDVPAPLKMPTLIWATEMNGAPGTMPAIDTQGRIFGVPICYYSE